MYDELLKRLRDAAKMSDALAVSLPHSEGNATAKLYNEAARVNETSSCNYCGCLACPNRDSHEYTITSNRTLTDKEIAEMKAKLDPDYGIGRFA